MNVLDILNKNILFLCTGNSCRSQMAEGLAKLYLTDSSIYSAGTEPQIINSLAIEVMAEIGIDISKYKSKLILNHDIKRANYIITLCDDAKDTCILDLRFENKHIHWNIKDPAKFKGNKHDLLDIFRKTRNLIEKKIKLL